MEINEEKSNLLYCPIKKSSRNRPRGRLRKKIFDTFNKKIYNKGRNPIEMIMFLLKHKGITIRAKKIANKKKEIAWKILAYNIERLAKSLYFLFNVNYWGQRLKY